MKIEVPDKVRELECVVSVSGGKDSTATCLALVEAGIPHRRVFADTGWEHSSTYEHLDALREKLGPIDVVGVDGGMVGKIRANARFPSRLQRWCTKELKIRPLQAYHDAIHVETCSVVGIRAQESQRRATMREFEDDEMWGGYVWRPILNWTVEDVLAIHHRHGIQIHPLYQAGMDRVGCWPCIFSRKEELRIIADIDPERISLIRELEQYAAEVRRSRNIEDPGRYSHVEDATFFLNSARRRKLLRDDNGTALRDENGDTIPDPNDVDAPLQPNTIDRVIEWARTDRGGKQLPLLPPDPTGGCFRWGLCEPPEDK